MTADELEKEMDELFPFIKEHSDDCDCNGCFEWNLMRKELDRIV